MGRDGNGAHVAQAGETYGERSAKVRQTRTLGDMCRNISNLYNFDPPASHEEAHEAALQYVRKVCGFTKPSKANEEAFARAVHDITHATEHLLDAS